MANKDNFKLIEDIRLQANADYFFNIFKMNVKNGLIKNDGTNDLLNFIDKYVIDDSSEKFYKNIDVGTELYRARIVDLSKGYLNDGVAVSLKEDKYFTSGYDEANSREAPLGVGEAGRNNIRGVSYLYLANSIDTACVEVKPYVGCYISVARFKVTIPTRIIDFSDDKTFEVQDVINDNVALGTLFTNIMRQYFLPISNKEDYAATQILTDYIRKSGIDGIAYRSFYDKKGINYTFFNSSRKRFKYIDSKLLVHQSERRTFLDFNDKKVRTTNSYGRADYNEDDAVKILQELSKIPQEKLQRNK